MTDFLYAFMQSAFIKVLIEFTFPYWGSEIIQFLNEVVQYIQVM